MNIARRLIHAAAHGENQPERLWWLRRPSRSFRKRIGTSCGRSRMWTDLSTISEAYSHDCERSPIRSNAARVMPRIPQWMSEKWLEKITFKIHVVTGVPRYRCKGGIAPGSMYPVNRDPMMNSAPSWNFLAKGSSSRKSYVQSQSPSRRYFPRMNGRLSM